MRQRLDLDVQTQGVRQHGRLREGDLRPQRRRADQRQSGAGRAPGARGLRHHRPRAAGAVARGHARGHSVHRDSPYRTLADLRGRRIAFGGSAHAFFTSHRPACDAAAGRAGGRRLHGRLAPGTGHQRPAVAERRQRPTPPRSARWRFTTRACARITASRSRLRVLAQSEAMPGVAWLVGPQLDRGLRDEIRRLLLQFDADAPDTRRCRPPASSGCPADNNTYRGIGAYLRDDRGPMKLAALQGRPAHRAHRVRAAGAAGAHEPLPDALGPGGATAPARPCHRRGGRGLGDRAGAVLGPGADPQSLAGVVRKHQVRYAAVTDHRERLLAEAGQPGPSRQASSRSCTRSRWPIRCSAGSRCRWRAPPKPRPRSPRPRART